MSVRKKFSTAIQKTLDAAFEGKMIDYPVCYIATERHKRDTNRAAGSEPCDYCPVDTAVIKHVLDMRRFPRALRDTHRIGCVLARECIRLKHKGHEYVEARGREIILNLKEQGD